MKMSGFCQIEMFLTGKFGYLIRGIAIDPLYNLAVQNLSSELQIFDCQ